MATIEDGAQFTHRPYESLLDREYQVKDSGKREEFRSGMKRDTEEGKLRYDLIPTFFLDMYAAHITKGAAKYGDNNWTKADSYAEYRRFRRSAWGHFLDYLRGKRDEDHLSATVFNLIGMEYLRRKNIDMSADVNL